MPKSRYQKKQILIVDDNDDNRQLKLEMLNVLGMNRFDTFEAPSYEDALKKIAENDFDLVLTDYDLGGMNTGVDLIEAAANILRQSSRKEPKWCLETGIDEKSLIRVEQERAEQIAGSTAFIRKIPNRIHTYKVTYLEKGSKTVDIINKLVDNLLK